MYKIQINKQINEQLNKNERIEDGQVFKYYKDKTTTYDYCYKNKISHYYKETKQGNYERVEIKALQEDVFVYVIYEVIQHDNTLFDLRYSMKNYIDYYTLEEIRQELDYKDESISKYVVTSIEEIEDKIQHNMLQLIYDKYIIFKEYETLESEE